MTFLEIVQAANVLVHTDGRVVLSDFGVTATLERHEDAAGACHRAAALWLQGCPSMYALMLAGGATVQSYNSCPDPKIHRPLAMTLCFWRCKAQTELACAAEAKRLTST